MSLKFTRKLTIFAIAGIMFISLWYYIKPKFGHKKIDTIVATSLKTQDSLIDNFTLITTDNKNFNKQYLKGHWNLLFFGYTNCPDICPATLNIMKETWAQFTDKKYPARFFFASINPNKDEIIKLKIFLERFNSDFIGVTGNSDQVLKLQKQLGVYAKQENNRIDHTAAIMLINPQAKLTAIFTTLLDPIAIASDLEILTR